MLNFNECTLLKLDKTFHLTQIETCPALTDWLNSYAETSDLERPMLGLYRQTLQRYVHDWNEMELIHHFIGPLFTLVNFSTHKFSLFLERSFSGTVDGIELGGNPDSVIASGYRSPEKPYFCFQEYKRERDPKGDPAGQVLAAMLVAQEINEHQYPVYGCYVVGELWHFVLLQGKEYGISRSYMATGDDIFEIFGVLKRLKQIITELVEQ